MQVYELRELDDDRRLRDEIINEAVNALEAIGNGCGAAGEKINRKKYAIDAMKHLLERWNECLPIETPQGEVVNPHVLPHVAEPQPDFDEMKETIEGKHG